MQVNPTVEPKSGIEPSEVIDADTIRELTADTETDLPENWPDQVTMDYVWDLINDDYTDIPVDIETFLFHEHYLGNALGEGVAPKDGSLYPFWLDKLEEIFNRDELTEVILCLHPDTKIPLLDGSLKTIEELAEDWEEGDDPLWVYGCEDGEIVPSEAYAPRQTGVDDYYEVVLDNGTSFECNARHEVVARTGEKIQVKDLEPGQSLMPFKSHNHYEGYEKVFNPNEEWFEFTHEMVARDQFDLEGFEDPVVHHEIGERRDNRPDTLTPMERDDHTRLHREHFEDKVRPAQREFMKSEEGRRLAIQNLSKATEGAIKEGQRKGGVSQCEKMWNGEGSEEQRKRHSERMEKMNQERNLCDKGAEEVRRDDVSLESIKRCIDEGAVTMEAVAEKLNCASSTIGDRVYSNDLTWSDLSPHSSNYHVKEVNKTGRGPVYCMTVPRTENFAITTSVRDRGTQDETQVGIISGNTGPIGLGKSTIAGIGNLYMLHKLLCLKNPQEYYGNIASKTVKIFIFSITEDKAHGTIYNTMQEMMKESPFFREHGKLRESVKREWLEFPDRNIELALGSPFKQGQGQVGEDIFGGCFPGSSRFCTSEGKWETFKDRVGERVKVKALDRESHELIEATARVVITGREELMKINLENGQKIFATEDQKFFVEDTKHNEITEKSVAEMDPEYDRIVKREVA